MEKFWETLYATKDTQIESIGSADSNFNDGRDDQIDVIGNSDSKNSPKLNKRLDTSSSYPGSTFAKQMISLIVLTRVVSNL